MLIGKINNYYTYKFSYLMYTVVTYYYSGGIKLHSNICENIQSQDAWYKIPYRELKFNDNSNSLEYKYANDELWINSILSKFKASGKEEIIIVNIGTDRCVGDSFAPFLGSLLELQGSKFQFYGTLEDPIHAVNMREKVKSIIKKHTNAFVIAIDSGVSEEKYLQGIYVLNASLEPGSALSKELETIGDISIVYNGCEVCDNLHFALSSAALKDVYKAAKDVYVIIKKLEEHVFV